MAFDLPTAVEKIEQQLPKDIPTTAWPVLFMISGLPGTGKSYLSRRLAERVSAVIIETDRIRKTLFDPPTYSAKESERVHRVAHQLIERLLRKGVRVIFDATNLVEFQRETVYHIADRLGAKLVIIRTTAPEEVVRERLARRKERIDEQDVSDADWNVYKRMRRRQQGFRRNFLVIDTSDDIDAAIAKIIRMARR